MATITWNLIEAVFAVGLGLAASSIALIAFGFDSLIEVSAAGVVLWEFAGRASPERERRALRLIAWSFFLLATYVAFEAVRDLIIGGEPEPSAGGVILAVASLVVMPLLALAKLRTGRLLGSKTLVADSKETLLCTYLSAVLLLGLALNALLGWWWADPVAGLGIAALAIRGGLEAWHAGDGGDSDDADLADADPPIA